VPTSFLEGSFYWTLKAEGKHVLPDQLLSTIYSHSKSLNNHLCCLRQVAVNLSVHAKIGGLGVKSKESAEEKRAWAARGFTFVEDVVYIGLGLLLAGSSLALLIGGVITFGQHLIGGTLTSNIVPLLDRILLILLVVELLYTVQVSFREHSVIPEPFLLVGLIAAIRRVLVLTAEFAQVHGQSDEVFKRFTIELGVLTVLIIALVISLVLLRKRGVEAVAERAT
jgi:uncharacterized membrane protein (DUF373 family)